jgi:hypothetical protein
MRLDILALSGMVLGTMSCAKGPSGRAPAETSVSPASTSQTPEAGAPLLACQIRAAPRIKLGQPVTVQFRLEQRSAKAVYVLNWRTPLEGLRGDDFLVVRDGIEVPYEGPTFKRGDPTARNYLTMEPGKSLEAEVDLALAYDFGKPGHYRIVFRGHVWDLVTQESDVPRPLDRHQPVPIQCAGIEIDIV